MILKKWEDLPAEMQTEAVRPYYDLLYRKRFALAMKRMLDILLALVLLILLSPVFLVLAIAIPLDSPGPVFYRQVRVTRYGKRFRIFKFRTMYQGADRGAQVTVDGDNRITRVGKLIRRCRLDEICQLLDVLRGTMTFVGTRPEADKFVRCYTPEMMATLLMPAGITSLASIYFRNEDRMLQGAADPDEVYVQKILPQKMQYNLQGLRNFHLMGDIKVLFMTGMTVLGRDYEPKQEKEAAQYD